MAARRIVPAGRARLFDCHIGCSAGAGTRPVESRARLDGEMRRAQKDWRRIDLIFP